MPESDLLLWLPMWLGLSFGAVAVLYLANVSGLHANGMAGETVVVSWRNKLWLLARMQLALLLMMLPLQWQWFGGISLAAPLINFIAVPWVSTLTVPMVLAAIATLWLPAVSGWLWWLADLSLFPVIWLAELVTGAWWQLSLSWLPYLFGGAGWLLILWFFSFSAFKSLHLVLALVIVTWQGLPLSSQKQAQPGTQWQLEMLDVGHGLALIIRRNGAAVLYDTGIRWQQGSIASSVIEPVLLGYGINKLDGLILSHADNDHAGGAQEVIDRLHPGWKRSSDRRQDFAPCRRGERWQWQQLDFRVLWPPRLVERAGNPHSCVIEISDRSLNPSEPTSVLLTGDIDAISELLLAKLEPALEPDILLVPHHGSKTSSTATWLSAMQPAYALVSVARYNPWQLPSVEVKQRYLDKKAVWLSTADNGLVVVRIGDGDIEVIRYRQAVKFSWFRP